MANLPQQYFTADAHMQTGPVGERQRYDSLSLTKKAAGPPKGVYLGFIPSTPGAGILTLDPDPSEGYSLLRVPSDDEPGGMTVIEESPISIDFSTALAGDFLPDGVQVVATASYSATAATTAAITPRTKTVTFTAFTVGGSPTTFDLSTISPEPTVPGSVSIAIDEDGVGADTIIDDGLGNLASAGTGLPLGGTIDYVTGAMTGTTAPLTAFSTVIVTRTRGIARDEVLVCELTGTPGAIVVAATPPAERDVPIAASGADLDFGLLESGSIEALAAAVEILNEVAAARLDLQGVTHPDLKTRLDTDLGATAMGLRLGKVARALRSNEYSVVTGATEANVSGSFSEVNRDYLPQLTLSGGGSEVQIGAVAEPVDAVRNVCLIVDTALGGRLMDNETDRNLVIGRLEQETDFVLDGVLTFSNALTAVSGDASAQFTTQLEVGDTIQGADGLFYEIATILSADSLVLKDAYQGATASSGGLLRRRFKLKFKALDGVGVEQDHQVSADLTFEFFFPAFLSVAQANFNAHLRLHQPGERPLVPDASTSVPGKVELAGAASPFAGSVHLKVKGVDVPGSPFHTLNFNAAAAQVTELASGQVNVIEIGPQGPTGPGGGPGPAGPAGNSGASYSNLSTLVLDSETALGPGPVPVTATLTVDFGQVIGFLSGGVARFRDAGTFAPQDMFEIDVIEVVGTYGVSTIGNIEATGGLAGFFVDCFIVLYLNAALTDA